MHRCIRLSQSTRRVYSHNSTLLNSQSRFSTSGASPNSPETPAAPASPPRRPRKGARTALLLTTLAVLGATAWHRYSSSSKPLSVFDERRFQPFTITSKTRVSPTSTIFTVRPAHPPTSPDPYAPLWPHRIWSLSFKQPQLQIARSYTPLPPLAGAPPDSLRFLIRREYKGEVSGYLDVLPVGATIEVRGPHVECAVGADVRDVVFLAGGTGIAPAMQAVGAVLGEGGEGRVRILWANRRREECAGSPRRERPVWSRLWGRARGVGEEVPNQMVKEIRRLQERYGDRVEVQYFVDTEGSFIDRRRILEAVRSAGDGEGRKMLMVSGPEGFVKHYAGARVWEEGEEKQGPVGGVIKGLGLRGWEVVKL